jgi:hypothetical protein
MNDNFACKQKLSLTLKMVIRQQKLNMDEIYSCCVRGQFSEAVLLAVMCFSKAMSTLGWTTEVKRGLQMCQRALQEENPEELMKFVQELKNSDEQMLTTIFNI